MLINLILKTTITTYFIIFSVLLGFVQISLSSCGPSKLVAEVESAKILTSPNFPGNYNTSITCSWVISSHYVSLNVQLKLVSFDTYGTTGACTNTSDNLEVYDAINGKSSEKLLARYCGSSVPGNLTISGTGNNYHLYIKFTSPSNKTRPGFKLEYMAAQDSICGSFFLNAELSKSKVLTSPSYPANYPAQTKCSWLITAPKGQYVKLNFTNFDLASPDDLFGSCNISNHTLQIHDSNQAFSIPLHLIGKYCGKSVPANVISSGRYLSVMFSRSDQRSSNYSTKQGFRLEYSSLSSPAKYYSMCIIRKFGVDPGSKSVNLRASSSYQYIQSPLYPDKYPSNLYCSWYIKAPSKSKKIKLEITDLKISNSKVTSCKTSDTLKIRGGDSYFEYCGLSNVSTTARTVTSSGDNIDIDFWTNTDNFFKEETAGFKAKFIEIEGNAAMLKTSVCSTVGIVLVQLLVQFI